MKEYQNITWIEYIAKLDKDGEDGILLPPSSIDESSHESNDLSSAYNEGLGDK